MGRSATSFAQTGVVIVTCISLAGTSHQYSSRFWHIFIPVRKRPSANIRSLGRHHPPYWQSGRPTSTPRRPNLFYQASPRPHSHSYLYLTVYIKPTTQTRCDGTPLSAKDA
ncbi:hypothetical protein QCA50_002344 [Cerrena zonata]|uniref:Secreted protein n=1 Tax=Cerrena zonata TaxID=2478898 RepID=A0AAW0GZ68_9APHY